MGEAPVPGREPPGRPAAGPLGRHGPWLAPACALLLLAAGPPLGWHAVAWLALAPVAAALKNSGPGAPAAGDLWRWLGAGWAFGALYYAGHFAWLHHAFVVQAGMDTLAFANRFALLVAVLALVPAAVFAAAWALRGRWGLSPVAALPALLAGWDLLLGVAPFGGLGWGSLAGPQAHTLAARLVVPALGGAGLVLLLGLVNAGWGAALASAAGRRSGRWRAGVAGWALLTALCAWPLPAPTALSSSSGASTLPALLVPGALSIAELRAQRDTPQPMRYYLDRTLLALAAPGAPARPRSADGRLLVIWPESAVPGAVARGKVLVELSRVAGQVGADVLLGSNAVRRGRELNSAYLVQGRAFDFARYDKRRLVPFGEYVPRGFRWLFPAKLAAGEDDYAAGSGPPLLDWHGIALGMAICFESVLPGHARAAVGNGARVLVVIANDAWLTPAAQAQHLQLTALQGLAVGRDVLFVANGGLSAHLRGGSALALHPAGAPPFAVRAELRDDVTPFARWGAAPVLFAAGALLAAAWAVRARAPRA